MMENYSRFTEEDHNTWSVFIKRQERFVEKFACKEFINGLKALNLSKKSIPLCSDVSLRIERATGWSIFPENSLVPLDEFFTMLSKRTFPINHKIRAYEELDFYTSPSPDIIHEYFGHCPWLMDKKFADFLEYFGNFSLKQNPEVQDFLSKIYWFTVEFGIIKVGNKIQIIGAGILPSRSEISSVISEDRDNKAPFDYVSILEKNYCITQMQPRYYFLNSLEQLYGILDVDIKALIEFYPKNSELSA